jgi:hypothetical protein
MSSPELLKTLQALVNARSYAVLDPSNVKTDSLRNVAASFFNNMMRVDNLALLLPGLSMYCMTLGAKSEVSCNVNNNPGEQIDSMNSWWFETHGYYTEQFKVEMWKGMVPVQSFSIHNPHGIQAWLASLVLGTWTAFETFAGDLWVATLNTHPRQLSLSAGKEKRISAAVGVSSERTEVGTSGEKRDSEKMISLQRLQDVTQGDYDLSFRMGDLLKARFVFTSFWDIRRAYSLAFCEDIDKTILQAVDSALKDNALDALSAARNVLIHAGGKADKEYIKTAKRPIRPEHVSPNSPKENYSNWMGRL